VEKESEALEERNLEVAEVEKERLKSILYQGGACREC